MKERTQELEKKLNYSFQDPSLLITALTHSSYANEHRKEKPVNNERLEFLGDAVLETVSSEYLYHLHPDKGEGWLSKTRASMVCEPSLAKCARDLKLPEYLRLGKGEEQMGGRDRDSLISDAVEALIGAVFLDGGFEEAKKLIYRFVLMDLKEEDLFDDKKTYLQELLNEKEQSVQYKLLKEEGPPHEKVFTMMALVDGVPMGSGSGRTKKAAAQKAAEDTIKIIRGKQETATDVPEIDRSTGL